MTLQDYIQDYLRFLRDEQRATPATVKTYQARLHRFQAWLESNGYPNASLDAFTTPILHRFLYALAGDHLRPRTIRGFFNPLRSLSQFLVQTKP